MSQFLDVKHILKSIEYVLHTVRKGLHEMAATQADLDASLTLAETALAKLQTDITNIQVGTGPDLSSEVARIDAITTTLGTIDSSLPVVPPVPPVASSTLTPSPAPVAF